MKKINAFISGLVVSTLMPVIAISTPFKPVVTKVINDTNITPNPVYKVGKPYFYNGVSYQPSIDNTYDQVGIASWYGNDFNGKLTSNGEIFNKNLVTAASATLPLPCIVEITNLDNNKKLIARVNDRGPYRGNRLIDVSERAAELLGFKQEGTAHVRVRVLPKISKMVAEQMPNYNQAILASNTVNSSDSKITTGEIINDDKVTTKVKPLAVTPVSENIIDNSNLENNNDSKVNNSINSSKLVQVSLQEPNSVQQYVPRGVFVQVGAFDTKNNNIKNAINSLSKIGVVTLQNIDLEGKNVLRVRVGPYGSIEDAGKIKQTLVQLGYKDPRIVIEE